MLGSTVAEIASDKVGIFRAEGIAVLATTNAIVVDIAERAAARVGATLWRLGEEFDLERNDLALGGRLITLRTPYAHYEDVLVRLHGIHQGVNAATAVVVAEASSSPVNAHPDTVLDDVRYGAVPTQLVGEKSFQSISVSCVRFPSANSKPASEETEAEAVAFIVGQAIGLEMGRASSDYIQMYAGNAALLAESLEVVQRASAVILGAIHAESTDTGNATSDVREPIAEVA